ncbi:hypothetical protein K661_02267 [Piscirickettsia salmonis LF-89 = ATCC VR-1361]|nr:hypothetical protein K661_02267 [Piscirickettsia salmonis LF-89 = ATCC VR-1361]
MKNRKKTKTKTKTKTAHTKYLFFKKTNKDIFKFIYQKKANTLVILLFYLYLLLQY